MTKLNLIGGITMEMQYVDFYEIAEYLNAINRNTFTAREVACNAYDYLADFQWSKANKMVARTIQELAKLLAEDNTYRCKDWLYRMATELDLLDMDYWDYAETDPDIVARFLAE